MCDKNLNRRYISPGISNELIDCLESLGLDVRNNLTQFQIEAAANGYCPTGTFDPVCSRYAGSEIRPGACHDD